MGPPAPPPSDAPPASGLRGYLAMRRSSAAIAELDGLRALAIVLVLLRHGVRPFRAAGAPFLPVAGWDLATPLVNGWIGVDLFFVLSGFLIAHHICGRYRRLDGRIDLRDYLARRALRIVPAYYTVLLVVSAGLIPAYVIDTRELGLRVGYHLLFLQDYLPSNILVTFWSLGVEEKFYLLAPGVLALVFRLGRRSQYAAIAVLALIPTAIRWAAAAHSGPLDYEAFFTRFRSPFHMSFDGLAAGMLCALLYRDRARLGRIVSPHAGTVLYWTGTTALLVLLCAQPLLDEIGFFDMVWLQTLLAAAGSALLLGLTLGTGSHSWCRSRAALVVSRLAYSLYLVHYALVPGARVVAAHAPRFEMLAPAAQFLLFLPVFLALSTGAALVLHYAVEKPFLLVRDRARRRVRTAA